MRDAVGGSHDRRSLTPSSGARRVKSKFSVRGPRARAIWTVRERLPAVAQGVRAEKDRGAVLCVNLEILSAPGGSQCKQAFARGAIPYTAPLPPALHRSNTPSPLPSCPRQSAVACPLLRPARLDASRRRSLQLGSASPLRSAGTLQWQPAAFSGHFSPAFGVLAGSKIRFMAAVKALT